MTTYYIATSGSDGNAGTDIGAPRKTVPSSLAAGDTVNFRAGNYYIRIVATDSGSSGSPITYKAYNSETVRIYGTDSAPSILDTSGEDWIVFEDLYVEFHPSLTELRSGKNNQVRTAWINIPAASSHCSVINCTIRKSTVTSVADAIADYTSGHRENAIQVAGDYTTIDGCYISGINKGIRVADDQRARDLWVKNNHIYMTVQSCMHIGRTDGNSRGALIEDNTFERSVIEDGIQFFMNSREMPNIGHYVRNNKFIDCGENAIDFKGVSRCVIEGNVFRGIVGSNNGWLQTANDSPNRDAFNVFGQGSGTDSERVIVRNNVFYDNCSGPGMKDREHMKIYHNVIHTNRHDISGPLSTWPGTNGVEFIAIKQPSAAANYLAVVNNIIGGHKPDGQVALSRNAADTRIDGNLYFTENGVARNIWMTGSTSWTAYGFSAWKAFLANQATIIGGDANSQWLDGNADVDFVNVPAEPVGDNAEFDFRVNVTSPAYHAGLPLAYALNSGSSSTNLKVDDPYMFSDGMGSGLYGPDTIFVGGTEVDIAGIDYATGIITLDTAISWDVGDGITWGSATPNIGLVDDVSGGTYVIADFTGTPLSGTAPLSVTFTDASSASSTITAYSWERNDGSGWVEFSTSASPAGVSFAAGSWSVRLTITTADGTNTKTRTNYVISSDSGGDTPNPSDNNQMVNGDFASGDLTNWKWYCNGAGDSAYVESGEFVANVPDKGSNTQLWYQEEAGASGISVVQGRTYVFRFKVRAGTSSVSTLSADVLQNHGPDYANLGLAQAFTASTSQETKEFIFVATASDENVRARVRWTGDIAQNLYFDDFELFEQVQLTVTFDTDVTPAGVAPRSITFADTSAGASPIASRVWKVNGTQVSTAELFSYTFASGEHTVSLTVTDTSGNSGTASTSFTVTAPSTGGTAGANVTVARAASNTSGGSSTQTIALDGLSDVPNFVMLICSSAASDGVAADHARLSIGFYDGTNQAGHAVSSESGLATTKTRRVGSGSAIYVLNADNNTVVGEAAITGVAIDELTLTWATLPASAFLITVVAGVFDGVAVTDVTQPAENSTTTVNTLGFTPTLLLAVTAFETMDETSSTQVKFSMGFVTASFAGGFAIHENNLSADGAMAMRLGTDYAIYQTQQGAQDLMQADVQIVSGGFSYQTLDDAGLGVTTVVAIDTGSAGVDAQVVTTPTSTGAANLYGSGLAFVPGLILGLATWRSAIDADGIDGVTTGDAGAFGVLAAVDGAAYSTAWAAEVGSATTDTQSLADDQFLNLPDDSGANAIAATAGAFASDNVPLTWSTVDATGRKMLILAIGLVETEAAAGRVDYFERGLMVGARPGMP